MRIAFFVVLALVALAVWDMVENDGQLGFSLERAVEDALHEMHLL